MPRVSENSARGGGISLTTAFVAVAAIVIVILGHFIFRWWQYQNPTEPIRVIEFSVSPTEVTVNQNATLKITIENLDRKSHAVKLLFGADPLLFLFKPTGEPLSKNDSNFTYSFVMESVQSRSSLEFVVKGLLRGTVSFTGYPISLQIISDEKMIAKTWSDITLTVKKS